MKEEIKELQINNPVQWAPMIRILTNNLNRRRKDYVRLRQNYEKMLDNLLPKSDVERDYIIQKLQQQKAEEEQKLKKIKAKKKKLIQQLREQQKEEQQEIESVEEIIERLVTKICEK